MGGLIAVALLLAGVLPAVPVHARVGYGIPPDNPFVNTPGAPGEVYVYGLRNPWRWSFDPLTGAMLIADVGGNRREEITFLPSGAISGANLGWNCFEGTFVQLGCRPPNYFRQAISTAAARTSSSAATWCTIPRCPRFWGAICTAATGVASTPSTRQPPEGR
jgi:glucose/arabinose dehydrogenase